MSDIHLNPAQKDKLKKGIQEITNSLIRMDGERENIKEIAAAIEKETGIKKAILNKVAKAHHSHKFTEMQMDNERFEFVYESLMKKSDD